MGLLLTHYYQQVRITTLESYENVTVTSPERETK